MTLRPSNPAPPRSPLVIADPVRAAMAEGRGVVALESTMLVHGMPPASRLEVADRLEREVRSAGAEPAVVAVMHGRLRIGLAPQELEALCSARDVSKCGERDLAWALEGGVHATTVSATVWAAARAGIRVFATGGIGGVHRGADATWDESQDLQAIARHPVAVVSAGAKAILDLPKTVERLETLGILVVGYRCREFPAFYCRESGIALEYAVDDVAHLARVLKRRLVDLDQGGVVVCNPIEAAHALARAEVERAIADAVAAAQAAGIGGKALTPYLLAALDRLTGGRSVEANMALAAGNARLGGELAAALARLGPVPL